METEIISSESEVEAMGTESEYSDEGDVVDVQDLPTPSTDRKRSRWDKYPSARPEDESEGKIDLVANVSRSYKSWRSNKIKILQALEQSNGNVAFTRRYMLYKNGVNVPKNVIHYYNSRYCRGTGSASGSFAWSQKEEAQTKSCREKIEKTFQTCGARSRRNQNFKK